MGLVPRLLEQAQTRGSARKLQRFFAAPDKDFLLAFGKADQWAI